GLDLLDAAARADRLIVQADAGLFLVGVRPFPVDRKRKGRAGACNVRRHGRRQACRRQNGGGREGMEQSHASLLFHEPKAEPARVIPTAASLRLLLRLVISALGAPPIGSVRSTIHPAGGIPTRPMSSLYDRQMTVR